MDAPPNLTFSNAPATASDSGAATPLSNNSYSSSFDDASKMVRKPYTVSKSRESWTEPENNSTYSSFDDASNKVRKPYTISKSRESWTEPEHDKFLEALQLWAEQVSWTTCSEGEINRGGLKNHGRCAGKSSNEPFFTAQVSDDFFFVQIYFYLIDPGKRYLLLLYISHSNCPLYLQV